MKASSLLSLPLCLAWLPAASAWIYTWHTPNDTMLSFQDGVPLKCKSMNNPEGNVFNWEPQDGHWCIYMYSNSDCEEPSVGHTCKDWEWSNHPSSKDILSFKVTNNTAGFLAEVTSSASASSSSSASASSSSASATDTPTSSPSPATTTATSATSSSSAANEPQNTGSKATPSGGAIAGIVVGVLAAVAIAGILIFFLCWRRRKSTSQTSAAARTDSTSAMAELSQHDEEKSPVSDKPGYQAQKLRELHGSNVASEIGSGAERYEIGSERHKMDPERYELDGNFYGIEKKD